MVAGPADGDDRAAGLRDRLVLIAVVEEEDRHLPLDPLDARHRDLHAGLLAAGLEVFEKLLLGMHLGAKLEIPAGVMSVG